MIGSRARIRSWPGALSSLHLTGRIYDCSPTQPACRSIRSHADTDQESELAHIDAEEESIYEGLGGRKLMARRLVLSRRRDVEILADLRGKEVIDRAMPGDRARLASATIDVDGVVGAFAQELAAVCSRCRSRSWRFNRRP
jgi:hypothetical protein